MSHRIRWKYSKCVFDKKTWYDITEQKRLFRNDDKNVNINVQWTGFTML